MSAEKFEDINLLPDDMRQKRAKEKETEMKVEYVDPTGELAPTEPDNTGGHGFLQKRKLPPLLVMSKKPELKEQKVSDKADKTEKSKQGFLSKILSRFKRNPKNQENQAPEPVEEPTETKGTAKVIFESSSKETVADANVDVKNEPANVQTGKIEEIKETTQESKMTQPAKEVGEPEPELGINLLSAEYAKTFVVGKQKEVFIWSLCATFLLLILSYLVVHLLEQKSRSVVDSTQATITELTNSITNYQDLADEDSDLLRKAKAVKSLLAKHISFKTFLEKLEQVTIPEVSYLNIAVAQTGGITMSAQAKNYTALARQLVVFAKEAPWIKEVNLTTARLVSEGGKSGGNRNVSFEFSLKVDEKIFLMADESQKQ